MSDKNNEKTILIELGKKIKAARAKKGYSQTQLSYNCNMEKSSVSKIEAGKVNISFLTLHRLSKCLEVDIRELCAD